MTIDLFLKSSSSIPFINFLHTVTDGYKIEPSFVKVVAAIVVPSRYFNIAKMVCHKKRARKIIRKKKFRKYSFSIFCNSLRVFFTVQHLNFHCSLQ